VAAVGSAEWTTTPTQCSPRPVAAGGWSEPVVWVGSNTLEGGGRVRVWSCEGHREGVEKPERMAHR